MSSKLAVQMFTLRDYTKTRKDLEDSLKKISDIGYEAIQFSAIGAMKGDNPEVTPEDARKLLEATGLKCIATHRSWDDLMHNTDKEIEFHKTFDCDFCAIGSIPPDYGHTAEGYRKFLQDATPVIEKLKQAGIRFGHHNHSKEFARTSPGGPRLEDILIDEGPADLMIELDTFWAVHGGVNPVRIIERCHDRVPVIHLKDKAVDVEEGPFIAPIGEGNIDWEHIVPACEEAGTAYYAVELDNFPRDPFDCLASSYRYLKGLVN